MPIEPPDGEMIAVLMPIDLAVEVEQRSAGIAAVDGGVGLDVVVVGAGIDVAVARRDDARGHGAAEAERVADRDYPFAEPQLVGIAELHGLERLLGLDPQHRQIDLGVLADQFGLDPRAVVEDDGDLVGVGDHVVVGDDDAGGVDDEAGAERVHPARLCCCPGGCSRRPGRPGHLAALTPLAAAAVEEVAEQLVELRIVGQVRRLGGGAIRYVLRGRDVDHRVDHLFGDVGDVLRSARQRRGCQRRKNQRCGGDGGKRRPAGLTGQSDKGAEHGRLSSWGC